jgi:ankyrin repeat protein
MKSYIKHIDTTSDDYYVNPYKFSNIELSNNLLLSNTDYEKQLNFIVKTLTSIIMSNNELTIDNNIYNNNQICSDNKFSYSDNKFTYSDKFIIFKYIANNDISELKKFLSKNNKIINIQDDDGDTALHIAIFVSNYDACNILINNNANMYIKDKWGQIAIHRLCFTLKNKNTIKIIDLILKSEKINNKKDIFNTLDKYNNTPLHLVIKYILRNNIVINKNILSIVNKLIEVTDINLTNNDGLTVKDLIEMLNLTK